MQMYLAQWVSDFQSSPKLRRSIVGFRAHLHFVCSNSHGFLGKSHLGNLQKSCLADHDDHGSISLSMMIQEWNKLGCWNLQWTKHVFTSWYFNILTIVLESSWFIKHDHSHHFFCPGTLLPCWMGWRPQTQNLALPLKIIAPHTPRDPGTSNSLDQAWPWNSMNFGIEKGVRKSPWEVSVEKKCQSENMKNHILYDTLLTSYQRMHEYLWSP